MTQPMRSALTLILFAAAAALFAPPFARAADEPDDEEPPTAEYIEYRSLPELGQITIADGVVRGSKTVARLRARAPELAKRGIFACVDADKPHVYRRKDELDGHKFETTIIINPPADEDEDWTRHVTVRVDGRKKVDCSIGSSPDGDVFVWGVTLFPEDGAVEVSAVDAEGAELVPPAEFESLDDPGVITDATLQPPAEDDEPEKPKTEKV